MNENPYEAPMSNPLVSEIKSEQQAFYVVSTRKFLALYLATLGAYGIYWSYKNWREYKLASNEDVNPVLRGIFRVFFTHALFQRVQEKLDRGEIHFPWEPRNHATILIALLLASNALDRMVMKSVGSPYTDFLSVAILAPLTFMYLKAQNAINRACGDEGGKSNDKFSAANIVWLVLGAAIWALSIYGLLPEA